MVAVNQRGVVQSASSLVAASGTYQHTIALSSDLCMGTKFQPGVEKLGFADTAKIC